MLFNKYSKSQILKFLEAPDRNEAQLRSMSTYLYNASNYYRRLIQYFSGMLTYAYILTPYNLDTTKNINEKTFKAQYQKAMNDMDKMNIKHEFQKVLRVAFKQDVFYGYIYETKDSFMILELNPSFCKIDGFEDGVYSFAFDCSYYDRNESELPNVDPAFKTAYEKYKKDKKESRWFEIPSDKAVCIKINEEIPYPIPPFVSLLSS